MESGSRPSSAPVALSKAEMNEGPLRMPSPAPPRPERRGPHRLPGPRRRPRSTPRPRPHRRFPHRGGTRRRYVPGRRRNPVHVGPSCPCRCRQPDAPSSAAAPGRPRPGSIARSLHPPRCGGPPVCSGESAGSYLDHPPQPIVSTARPPLCIGPIRKYTVGAPRCDVQPALRIIGRIGAPTCRTVPGGADLTWADPRSGALGNARMRPLSLTKSLHSRWLEAVSKDGPLTARN